MRTLTLVSLVALAGCAGTPDSESPRRRASLSPGERAGNELIEYLETNSQEAFDAGDFEAAEEGFGLLEANGCPEFGALRGKCLLFLGRDAEAELALLRALDAKPLPDTAFDLAIARFHLKDWDGAWYGCGLCLQWSESGSRLNERAAELGLAIARRLEGEARKKAWSEIARWAGETESGKKAAEELK